MKKLLLLFTIIFCTVQLFSQGTISTRTFTSSALGRSMSYNVYLPPSYNQNSTTVYPVLYLFHGKGGRYFDWANNGAAAMLNTEIANGAKQMIVIMPDGIDSYYNNATVAWETYFYNELIPDVQRTYRAGTNKQNRAIAGLSMGGWGTTYYWIKYSSMYSSAYSMSGAFGVRDGIDIKVLINNLTTTQRQALSPYSMEIGLSDATFYPLNVDWHNFLNSKAIPHTYLERAGGHDWTFWKACLPKAIRFASQNFTTTGTTSYRIKNRWQNTYLYDAGDRVRYSATPSGTTYQWVLEDVGGGLREYRNLGTGEYMHIENLLGYVQCTARTVGWTSSRWASEDAGSGFIRIRNAWQSTQYMHIENLQNQAQYGTINTTWYSAQWILELVSGARQANEEPMQEISQESNIRYWPTVVDRELNIETDGSYKSVEVIDMIGRVFHRDDAIEGKESLTIDVSHLSGGVHIVKLLGIQTNYLRVIKK
jgi:enterochelin esterase-like enzyme